MPTVNTEVTLLYRPGGDEQGVIATPSDLIEILGPSNDGSWVQIRLIRDGKFLTGWVPDSVINPDTGQNYSILQEDFGRQSSSRLEASLNKFKRLAEKRTWRPAPNAPLELRITTIDSSDTVTLSAVEAICAYTKDKLGLDLNLLGGGYGCFAMDFVAQEDDGSALDESIIGDPHFQALLNDLNAHTAEVTTRNSTRTYCPVYEIKLVFATNRNLQTPVYEEESGSSGLFGIKRSEKLSYGIAEVDVQDLSKGQPKESLLRRVWRRFTLTNVELRAGQGRTTLRKFDLLNQEELGEILSRFEGNGAITFVHGYASSFDAALKSASRVVYQSRIDKLKLFPILFSWPSQGTTPDYFPDTGMAENSERPLLDLLRLISSVMKGKEVDVLAHSHGNKILVRSLSEGRNSGGLDEEIINQIVLAEPDVEVNFLKDRMDDLLKAARKVTLYHANNDRALLISELIFKNTRVGRAGLIIDDAPAKWPEKLELIDASLVSRGISKHAPHVEAPEVISDIHHLLRGMTAGERFNLSEEDRKTCRWKVRPQ
jgi:esterase/lipase superfamily enzyme